MPKRAKVNEYQAKALAFHGTAYDLATGRPVRDATLVDLAYSAAAEDCGGAGYLDPETRSRWLFVA